MCGIAGEINNRDGIGVEPYHLEMIKTLKRRGPDDDGVYSAEGAVLLHARLAVIDVEKGRQPMRVPFGDGEAVIVYNGELYNTEDIRAELRSKGEHFFSHSDTEVLLKAYLHWGEDCLKRFNGIYAFAIWDTTTKRLFMARDRMGVKPFFYAVRGNSFVFGSELKTMLCHPKIEPVIDKEGISELLFVGPGRTPGCGVFKDVFELMPGQSAMLCDGDIKIKEYFKLVDCEHAGNAEQTTAEVGRLVTDAIERQLVSDVPIGTFLSGGLDSSIISAIASKYLKNKGEQLKTFSVTFKDNAQYFRKSRFQPNSDEAYIKIMAEYLGSEHHDIVIDTGELCAALFSAVDARDLPGMADVDSSLLLFCGEIKKHITVALSGECADEIFGGYPWYRDEKIRSAYGFPWAQSTPYRESFVNGDLKGMLNGTEYVQSRYEQSIKRAPKREGLSDLESRMREMVYLNTYWFMQTLLDRKDRMSMHNGLEVRVPFCDHRIAEYMYSVPWEYKDLEGREKGLLRAAMQGLLPDEILWRKKSPYPKTHNPTYLEAVKRILEDILSRKEEPIFALMNRRALEELLITERTEPWYGQLMTTPQTIAYIIQLNYWMTKYKVVIKV